MQTYIIRRLLLVVPTLLMVTLIVFFLARFIPGNVIDLMVSEMGETATTTGRPTAELAAILRHQLGLDIPVHIQYVHWVGNIFRGDFGNSLWSDTPIIDDIKRRVPVTLELGVLALIIKLIISLPIGTYAAIRQDTLGDYGARSLAIAFVTVPNFWVATMVIVYPSIWWNWTPPLGYIAPTEDLGQNLLQFILPAFIMGMSAAGGTMRVTRTMMLEVLRQDYIRTAWAKGLSERTVIMRHALKNALIPVVTNIGNTVSFLLAGSVIIENIFVLPGIGQLLLQGINQRDYPVISIINLMVASVVLLMNLLVDLTYAYLDPRVHYT